MSKIELVDDSEVNEEQKIADEPEVKKRVKVAWSDDLSHNSEEERERDRLAQLERELAEQPVKPVYEAKELQTLVSFIMRMTTLYDLRDEDWNKEAKKGIEDWITEPKALILCVYFKGDRLKAASDIPLSPVYDLTYFLRQPDFVFKAESFHDDIVFGTFVDSIEANMIQLLELMYAPYFFAIKTWPDSVKSEFCSQLHTFLAKLTDMYYKMLGLTVLYIPREGQHLSFEKASVDRELVKRLEGVVVYWTHQIKSCIEDQASVASQKELLCPSDEYEFWVYRHENLNALVYQLKNPAVKHITKILVTTHSTFIHQFQSLCDEIMQKINEATSNIEYLQIIKQPCAVLECVVDPDEICKHIPKIINLFRFIWMESPYYNSETRITNLFKGLSNQIIILCKNYIKLDDLFSGQTKKALGEFTKCIDCCKQYREIYDLMAEAHSEKKPGSWELDTGSIFNYIDSFVQRCFDMLDVCNCMIIFGRIDELEVINKPMFGGARGDQFEAKCDQIEHMFLDALDNVRAVSYSILDVQAPSWYDDILQFRTVIKDIEIIIENLVETVFEGVNHVEEAVIALFSLHNYSKRKNLRRIFKRKTAEVWAMFSEEVQEAKKETVASRGVHPADLPSFAGRAVVLRMRRNRLAYLKKVLTDASVWLMPCSNSEDVIMHVNRLMGAIDVAIRELWISWTHNLDEKCAAGLNRTLMRKSPENPGLMECNIDVNILELCKEAAHWENLNMDIPLHAFQVYMKCKTIFYVYESVLAVVKGYNKILDSLSEQERQLFKPLILACEKKVQPGISKLTWTSTMSDAYIADCVMQIGELQDFVTTYKNCNINLVKIMEKVCDTPLIEFDIYNVFEIKDLRQKVREMEEQAAGKILDMYKEVITYIIIVYEGFETYISQMADHWIKYVRRFDQLLEDALRLTIKATMQNMYKCVHGDGTMAPSPLIKMSLYLSKKNEIIYVPTRNELEDTFTTVLEEIVHLMSTVPRLFEKFGLPAGGLKKFREVIASDADSNKLQSLIDTEIEYNLTLVREHIRMWDPYSHIWKVNKDDFMVKYREEGHSAADFDALIINYSNLANAVQIQETVNQIHFITLNSSELKKSIIAHCLLWQTKLGELLRKITEFDIDIVYAYIEKSSVEAMTMPADLKELATAMATYERLVSEIPTTEKTFPPISDKMMTLAKFEVELGSDMLSRHENIPVEWTEYLALLEEAKKALEMNKDKFKAELLEQAEVFKEAAKEFCEDFYKTAPCSSDVTGKDALAQLKAYRDQLNALRAQEQQIRDGLAVFNLTTPVNLDLQKMEKELEKLEEVWGLVFQWEDSWEKYKTQTFWEMETDEMEENVMYLFRNFNRLSRQLKDKGWDIIDTTRVKVDAFRRTLPLIGDLKNPCMRERHWDRIKTLMGVDFDQNSEDFKLDLIMKLNFQVYADEIAEISNAATMELNIENGLKAIREVWKATTYEMQHHKGDMYKIKNVEDVMQFLEDHQVQLASMKSTKYVEPFIKEVDYWEKSLGYVAECIEISLQVQRRYLYLESIFSGEDIRKQLPSEVKVFDALTADWTEITSSMYAGSNAVEACLFKPAPYLFNKLNKMVDNLDGILRALEKYLETKRQLFPRFYFISNDDLLEILGNSKKPQLIQVHLKKLFDNVNKIRIDKNALGLPVAKAMMSEDGECIEWKYNLVLDGPAEVWLLGLEQTMRVVLREEDTVTVLKYYNFNMLFASWITPLDWLSWLCFSNFQNLILTKAALRKCRYQREQWINDYPGQLGITCSKIQWTSDCTRTLCRCDIMKEKKPLKKLRKKQNQILATLQIMSRKEISKILRCKVNALCVIEIHSRDTVDRMYKLGCMSVTAFEWFSQLKFYWDREREDCYIRQTNTNSVYTYEYIGNSGRLVITPLTDRCYITLTTALHLFRGGSPQGPAGTGKTETTKDLGRALARWVVVTNCSDGLDYKSMAKCFAGIAQSGCWGCFDEFNRINIEVLSVVAQQILAVLLALSLNLKHFVFEGSDIKLDGNCGIFITMNPGYAGRTELPDNLKSMFRPIAMCVPDSLIIAENTLFSDGFTAYKINAKKVFTLYQLAMQQLSKQDHYDFGLRSMVALLRYAGVKRRAYPHLPEQEMVILAMRDMNVARLTAKDVPLFDGIMRDIFPDVEIPTLDYEMLETAITAEMRILSLQPTKSALHKVIQTYETKNSRHSSILLGDTNTAKSISWKMLAATLSRLHREKVPGFENVQFYPINPKALTLGELYGEYNLGTGEWKDGVLSSIMRTTCQDESPDQKWIIFDGPVDAVWIENLNSVMDDNKLLTLVNSERISMPSQVSLLIETLDLSVASPATVSRNGIVYNDYKDWGWWPFVNSWLESVTDLEYRESLRRHFLNILTPVLELKRLHLVEGQSVRGQELTGVRSLCRLLGLLPAPGPPLPDQEDNENFSKMRFLFAMIWSVCATLEEESRRKLDNWVREHEGVFPLKDTVYDYYVDERLRQFKSWEDRLPDNWRYNPNLGFHTILVPTVEFIRVQVIALEAIRAGHGVLVGGSTGTGKTFLLQGTLASLDPERYSTQVINMSAQTTAANVQDIIEARLEKRTKGNYVPAGGKRMIAFMDDINMPVRDEYGSQPPLELVRLWYDYGYWFDRQKQWRKNVKDMVLCGAAGPPGGARSPLPPRLLSCFHAFFLPPPTQQQLVKIFGTMLSQHLQEFDEETKTIGKIVLLATIDMFNNIVAKLLPTPSKMHYLFNLRDISKIFQGLLRSNKDYQNTKPRFLRLWVCECFRVFSDRLTEEKDRDWFMNQMGDMLGKHFELTFHALCPTKSSPIFGHFLNPFEVYDDLNDPAALRRYITNQMEEYNSCPGVVKMDLVLFKDAIEHICRIVRVISQPRGHMLCVGIGGSGRQSLTRVASYISECNSYQVVVTKTYGIKDFREDLKVLYTSCGVDTKKTTFIFCDTQIVEETFTEIVNNLLSSGEVTNLYKADEFEDIKQALEKPMKAANLMQTNETVYLFLVDRVRANMHIVLCFSPIGDEFRNRIRQYPALINATTTNWFLEWPREALLEVAYKFLEGVELLASITGPRIRRKESLIESREDVLRASVASIMSLIHSSVGQYSVKMWREMRRTNYVTPTNYLELVSGYKEMLKTKRVEIALQANKLRNGLGKVEETTKLVGQMSEELAIAQVQVADYTEQCIEYMGVINVQQRNADEQQRSVAARSKKTQEEEVQCKKLADAAMRDLASAMPALEEAVKALDALNKKDITEVKSYAKPPQKVEMVMEAVLILLQKEPTWSEAKRQLGDQYFLDRLREFDKDNISDKTLKKIGTYTCKPDFDPEIVGTVSLAAKSLCLWVRAIEKYGKVYKIVKPKKERLEEALESLRMKQQILAEARAKLKELSEMIARLQKEYDEKVAQKEELERKSKMLQLKLERAEALITGLSGERERWELTVERLDKEFDNLPGDCLIATGFVAYLGPFVSEYREALMFDWFNEVCNEALPVTMDLSMKVFLLDDATLRDWNYMGLPDDNFSAENGIIVVRATRWPLAVDPQGQALIWISRLEEKNDIQIVDFGQPNYLKIMETCLSQGTPIIVQNVGEVLDPSIAPILDKAIVKIGHDLVIKFNEKMVPYNTHFKMYLTTKLGNPVYTPETLTKTTMVNFAVKEQGLTSQLLSIVVRKERPQLETMKDNLVMTIAKNKKTLVDLENDLLRIMYESQVPLLENEELFITLQTSQRTSLEVKEALITSQVTEKEIDTARQGYVPVAVRASVLFFALNDLSRIDPMYQFSLDAYIDLFTYSIDRSPKGGELEDRINNLNEFHTFAVYKNTCRALFERHKLLLSFHMVSRILFQMGKMSTHEYLFLLKGGVVLDRSEQPDNPTNWLPEDCWDNVTEMDKLPGFHGIIDAFEVFSKEWKEWYLHPEPESQPLIGEWNDICNEFQRILFVRSLRVDRVSACITTYIVNVLGPRYVEPPVLDIRAAWEESTWKTSLLFVLSPGVDPTSSLIQLAIDVKMFDKFQSLSLGQGQAPTAAKMLSHGMKEGGWVFLANCHLACIWLGSLRGLDNPRIHPRFRLWLSSMPDDKFPLNVLQRSIKMTTEPPQGLKGNLVRLFANLNEDKFDEATPKYRRLLFCVSFFHCSLIARKRFRHLGYNAVYSFNDSDFEVSDNLLANYLEEYEEVPWDALRYLFAIINYGGHITDDWDIRVLIAYINQFFCEEALDTPFYRLSSIPSYHLPRDGSLESYRDFLDLLPAYERAESVGQHASADVAALAQDARIMCSTLFALASTGGGGGGGGEDQKVDELAAEMLSKLPFRIDVETTERMMGPEIVMPMCVSLLQEIGYYNTLISGIVAGLKELRRAIEGLVVMSDMLEIMYTCIFEGRVPSFWQKARPSMKPLGAWCRELYLRGAHLTAWANAPRSPPTLCWLPALVAPTGFLTAVMQTTARGEGWPIDTLCWEFTVMPLEENAFVRPPRDGGVYIRGLYLEGASWFRKDGHLQEPLPMQLVFPMTPIHFKPIRSTGRRLRNRYICPTYYYPLRKGAFVVAVDLPAGKENSDFWGLLRSNKDYQNTKPRFLRLWVCECFRVFSDRLTEEKDRDWFMNQMGDMLGKHFELTFHALCPTKSSPIFGHFLNPFEVYDDLNDPAALRRYIANQMEEYNSCPGVVKMDLVLFKDAIEHICRIVRVISQPRGHMLCVGIGGSGRQSLTRVASYISECNSYQVVVTKTYGIKDFREDLKVLYTSCGVDTKKTTFIFCDTQIVEETFTEIVNNLLSSGEVTNLYKADEFEDIKQALEKPMKAANLMQTNETVYLFLVDRVRANMHIVLCFSPIGDEFRNRIRQYPALINATTTNWFLEWPREALLEVAYKFLEGVELLASITGPRIRRKESLIESREDVLRASVASIMSLIHSSVGQYSVKMWREMRRTNYVTPTNYLELVSGYKEMLKTKRVEIALQANKLRNGLGKVEETTKLVGQMSEELAIAQVQVADYTEQCIEYMGVINVQQRNADEQQRSVAARSKKTQEEEVQCKKLADAAMRDLASAMPALEEAVKALDALNKKDITEVKSYAKPPQKVEMVMEAVLILLQKEPTWSEAKRQLGDQYFLDRLREFDKDNISDKTLKKIGTYTCKPDFDPEIVGTVSLAAKSLCLWVRAIEKYGKVYKIVKPKKERLEEALESLRMKQQILAEARAKLKELSEMIARLQKEYDEKVAQKEELERKSKMLQLKLERAEALITGLSGERERWELTVERLDKEFDNLPGDCLIATGFVAYLGPFVSEYREALMFDWFNEVCNEALPVTMDLSMKVFLLDDATLRDWNYMGLPDDNFSAENGIIVVRATRWPLAVDPQGQALIWISRLEEKNDIQIVDFGQPNYLKIMETCLSQGTPIIVQNVGEVLDPSIAPILDKAIVKIGHDLVIKFNEKMVPYNTNFKMYLTTKLGNPVYTPETLTKTTMVNFAVKEQGLTSQLLSIVVRKERPQLETMKDNLVMTIAKNKKTLVDLENDLLRIMYESQVPLLENEELFITLQTSQRTSLEVKEALITSQVTEKEIDTARQGYVPVAVRASVLFFALNDLSRIDPMYQFSLDAYIDLFTYSIDRSPKGGELEDRINNLNEFHTFAVYKNTCRALFERHKLLLSFHMVSRILFQMGKMSTHEYLFLLKGGVVLDRSEQPDNPTNWLPEDCWDNVTEMDKLPGFHGIIDAFEVFSKEWKEWYLHPEPESQPLIGEWNDICNEFQRILFVRSLRVDRVSACITTYIVNVLGPRYVEPPVLDIRAAWEESTWKTSLLFVLSPGVDPTSSLIQLAIDVKMFDKFQSLSLGQGQAPTAAKMLSHGMKEGGWVFLANCHLACIWLGSLRGLDNPRIHPRFRLWLSSMPDDKFPLNVLQRSIKMTTEPPQGLKGNLVRLFANLNEDKFDEATPKYRRLLFCVSFFHCSLIARKRFRHLGYNAVYSFNDSDFEVSDNLLANYLEEYEEVPWDALRYLFAIINYGGHITDDWDIRVLIAYINQFFCEEALDTPFYRLSSIPSYHLPRDGSLESYRDFLDLLPAYERAESVGQHASADVAALAQDARIMCSTLFALASTGGGGGGGGEDQKVDELAAEMLSKLPFRIDVETTERMMGPEIVMPMCVSLLQEIGYYNTLISGIVAGLKELRRAIEGLVVMSDMLEIMYTCIFEGRVPSFWQKARPSMKPLGAWCRELYLRGAHLTAWANAPRSPPTLCWLPALVAPTGFLTAVMQTTARGEGWPIDTLCWEFTVMPLEENAFVRPPRDGGVYIRGLYLEGASWFRKDGHLQEPLPMQLVFPMTPIHFKPIRSTGRRLRNRYICPTYYYPLRKGAFVVAVDLPAGKENSDFWVKRGTALLCTLAT